MVSIEWPNDMSQEMNAIPLPVLTGFVSVGSVLSTKFGNPWAAHVGAVAKSARASLLMTAAHHRDKASPVLTPHRFPPIEHSLSSASNSADTRAESPNEAHTSIAAPFTKSQLIWSAPPVPSVLPPRAKTITLTGPPVVPKMLSLAVTTRSASLTRSCALVRPGWPRVGSTYTVTFPLGLVPTNCEVPV